MNAQNVIAQMAPHKNRAWSAKRLVPLIVIPGREDWFATSPVPVVMPVTPQADEAELHNLFDQALSERLASVQWQLSQASGPLVDTPPCNPVVPALLQEQETTTAVLGAASALPRESRPRLSQSWGKWRYSFMCACLALMCMLLGFDVMGLLILHLR